MRPTPPPTTPPPTTPNRPQPAIDAHLSMTNAKSAQAAGFTGQGVVIGVIDTGVNRSHPALNGRVLQNLVYVDPATNNLNVDDVAGHGTAVAQIIAGKPFGQWPGGIAPNAQLVSARIINDKAPPDDGSGQGNEVPPGDSTPQFLGQVNADLINAGVRITNNSWGGLYWNNASVTDAFAAAYAPFVLNHGGLVVFATGNEGNPQPSDTASLPSQGGANAAALEKGWLAVAWLNNANPSTLDPDSNACGVAMNYCLVAPGGVIATGTNDTAGNPTYWQWFGTSLATPQVTGAAALVWEAFPYFDNDMVRQTLLGGAVDLGAPGVDAVFGYGLLDVGKSVQGPSKFNWGDAHANFDVVTSVWKNGITGSGGLVKTGSGTLELAGNNSYSGATEILGGLLKVSGDNTQSTFHVGPQGNLSGTGRVGRNLNNDGKVIVQGATDLRVGGDYRQGDNATLAVDLGNQLRVDGQAFLDGTLHVAGVKAGYTTHSRETVLTATGGRNGVFDEWTSAPSVFLNASLGYDATTAWLDITSISVTAVQGLNYTAATTASAARVENAMQAIDQQIAAGDGAIGGGFIAAAGDFQRAPTLQAAEASLGSLSGELHAAADAMTYESIDAGRRALSARFGDLGERGVMAGLWHQDLAQSGGMARAGFSGFDYDLSGRMTGLDMRIGRRGVLGIAASHTMGAGWLDERGDRSRSRQDEGQLYAGWIGERAYLQGRLGFGRFERKVDRSILLGQRQTGAATAYTGDYDVAHAEAGWRHRFGEIKLTPYVASQYARIRNDGFIESGADGFGLKANAAASERWQAIAGLRANRDWQFGNGFRFGLEARAEWQDTLAAHGTAFEASFVGVDQWQTLSGIGLADRSRLFGIGMNFGLWRDASLRLDFGHRRASNLEDTQASLQYAFGF
ncbi:MAG TPA: S8 family serine peptidase [Luteimonas sp.]|nr:S8 family serine peptidase [Luteimonas sp.]